MKLRKQKEYKTGAGEGIGGKMHLNDPVTIAYALYYELIWCVNRLARLTNDMRPNPLVSFFQLAAVNLKIPLNF